MSDLSAPPDPHRDDPEDDDWPSGPPKTSKLGRGTFDLGKTTPCPKCGADVPVPRGIGWADWRLVPGNAILCCPACGHMFRAPRSVVLSTRLARIWFGGGIVFLILIAVLLYLMFQGAP